MLAYVFWHQRASHVAPETYREKLQAFHQRLWDEPPAGLLFSFVLQIPQLPWIAGGRESYEDWYLLEHSGALDALNEAAVTGGCQQPHQQVAQLAGYGTGGLYRLKEGTFDPAQGIQVRFATWFQKPTGMNYASLSDLLRESRVGPPGILWQRQMTLGPALEFCLHSSQKPLLGPEIEQVQVEVQVIIAAHPEQGHDKPL